MPTVRVGDKDRDVRLRGNVYDHADLLCSVARTALRAFIGGPWGDGDPALAQDMIRRIHTPPCAQQCFVIAHADGSTSKRGCHCPGSGWHYTSDEDVQKLEGKPAADVWNDPVAILKHHQEIGGGDDDPIKCDCDDLALILAAVSLYEAWIAAGCPMRQGLPIDPPDCEIWVTITQPPEANTAHAYVESGSPLIADEPILRLSNGLYVTDPAKRWGMRAPPDSFYSTGKIARYRLRMADLFQPR